MNELSHAARGVDWLITDFVSTVPGGGARRGGLVRRAAAGVLVGIPGRSGGPAGRRSRRALTLTQGAARVFEGGAVNQTIVEMHRGLMLIMSVSVMVRAWRF